MNNINIQRTFKNTLIGIHGAPEHAYEGGIYNMLGSFTTGLYNALQKKVPDLKYVYEYFEKKEFPHFSIGFNVTSLEIWDLLLDSEQSNIMWNVDSVFYDNFHIIQKYSKCPNFGCICLSKDDAEAIKSFMPNLNSFYMPLAIDPEIWKSDSTEKTRDIIFLASIEDVEAKLKNLKSQLVQNPETFNLYYEMILYSLKNPSKNFWEIYSKFNLIKDIGFYSVLFKELTYLITYARRIELIKYLSKSGLNVEIYGNGPWEKYISGNVKYMGSVNLFDAIKIIKSAKIALNLQPLQILNGIHDRIMNSSAANTFVCTDKNTEIYNSYGNNLCYIKKHDFGGLADVLDYYLKNDEARIVKAKAAQTITLKNHTWDNRADEIIKKVFMLN